MLAGRLAGTRMTGGHESDEVFWASAFGNSLFEGFCRNFFRWYSPLTVEGQHYLPDGPFLICSNHTSHADSAVLMTASGRPFSSFALMGARDYFFQSRHRHWLVSQLMNVIPVDRQLGSKSLAVCLATCRQFLERTEGALILYPEGTRSPDGEMQPFKAGAGLFAIELGVPVVPAYIEGTHRILPKGSYLPRAARVTVRFGEPLVMARSGAGAINELTTCPSARDRRRRVIEQLTESIRMLRLGRQSGGLVASVGQKG
jgi:1-acyl-sn-glycerol-3-phosphate acyltransferase